jgi:hypothetical protein
MDLAQVAEVPASRLLAAFLEFPPSDAALALVVGELLPRLPHNAVAGFLDSVPAVDAAAYVTSGGAAGPALGRVVGRRLLIDSAFRQALDCLGTGTLANLARAALGEGEAWLVVELAVQREGYDFMRRLCRVFGAMALGGVGDCAQLQNHGVARDPGVASALSQFPKLWLAPAMLAAPRLRCEFTCEPKLGPVERISYVIVDADLSCDGALPYGWALSVAGELRMTSGTVKTVIVKRIPSGVMHIRVPMPIVAADRVVMETVECSLYAEIDGRSWVVTSGVLPT